MNLTDYFAQNKCPFNIQTQFLNYTPGSNLRLFELKPVFVLLPLLLEVGGAVMEKFFLFFLLATEGLIFRFLVFFLDFF